MSPTPLEAVRPVAPTVPLVAPPERRRRALFRLGICVSGLAALVALVSASVGQEVCALAGGVDAALGLLMALAAHSRQRVLAKTLCLAIFTAVPGWAAWQMGTVAALLLTWVPVYPLVVTLAAGRSWGYTTAALVVAELVAAALLFPEPVVIGHVVLPVPVSVASGVALTVLATAAPSLTEGLVADDAEFIGLLDHARDHLFVIDPIVGEVVWANAAAEESLGFGPLAGVPLDRFVHPDPGSPSLAALAASWGGRRVTGEHERADGSRFPAEVMIRPAMLGGRPMLVAVVRDVTERRARSLALETANAELEARVQARTEEVLAQRTRLVEAQRLEALGQMAGSIAHDFNNMLAVITYASRELDEICPPEGRAALEDVQAATAEAISMTRELLSFARRGPSVRRRVDTAAAVDKAAGLGRRLLGRHVGFQVAVDPGTADVFIDPVAFERVVINLMSNAAQAGAETVHVSTRSVDDMVELVVQDDGRGMGPETLARVR